MKSREHLMGAPIKEDKREAERGGFSLEGRGEGQESRTLCVASHCY